jgi:hypothetical protein
MRWRCASRQSCPVLSRKFATASFFLCLFLLFSHVVLMFCHYVSLDEAMASWENYLYIFRHTSFKIDCETEEGLAQAKKMTFY